MEAEYKAIEKKMQSEVDQFKSIQKGDQIIQKHPIIPEVTRFLCSKPPDSYISFGMCGRTEKCF